MKNFTISLIAFVILAFVALPAHAQVQPEGGSTFYYAHSLASSVATGTFTVANSTKDTKTAANTKQHLNTLPAAETAFGANKITKPAAEQVVRVKTMSEELEAWVVREEAVQKNSRRKRR